MSETVRLLRAAREGSQTAFDDLYARHRGRLLAFAAARLDGRARGVCSAEDIVQETHLESARRLDEFEPEGPAAFYRWLVTIAGYKIREARRRAGAAKRAREQPLAADPAPAQTSPSGRLHRAERGERIAAALAGLPEAQAEAVRLRYLEGLTVAETAARLAKTPAAVKMLVSRGLAGLAAFFSAG